MHLKMSSAKCLPFCSGLDELNVSSTSGFFLYLWNLFIQLCMQSNRMVNSVVS